MFRVGERVYRIVLNLSEFVVAYKILQVDANISQKVSNDVTLEESEFKTGVVRR